MRGTRSSSSRTFVFLLSLVATALATTANAGVWTAVYDLAPGSTITTLNPGGTFVDPITGSFTMEYDAASTAAPLTGARLIAGQIDNTLSQPVGVLTVTGSLMNALAPPASGTPGTLSGAALNLSVVAGHTVSGFLHCLDATGGPLGLCAQVFPGFVSSTPIPQTGTGTFALPLINFAATAGVGDFTSAASVQMPQAGVTTTVVYVGKEISRTFMPEPSGVAMLVPGVLLLAGLRASRRSSAK